MRDLSRREFYLILLCPGLLIIGIYCFFFDGPSRDSLKQAERNIPLLQRGISVLDQTITVAKRAPQPRIPRLPDPVRMGDGGPMTSLRRTGLRPPAGSTHCTTSPPCSRTTA